MLNNEEIISKIKGIISQKGERPKVISEKISNILKKIPYLENYINEKDPQLKNDIFYDLGRYINYHKFQKGNIIQHICEGDNFFYLILSGEIAKIGIKYKKITTTFKEYILHISKLQLLEEFFLLSDSIEKNQDIFPIKPEKSMIKIFQKIQSFDYKNELIKIKKQINESKWRKQPYNIDDFLELVNPSFLNGKLSFLSKEMKFPVLLPYYIKDEVLSSDTFIGNLLRSKGIKEFSSYICINNADVLYIDKSTIAPGCKLMNIYDKKLNYSVIDNIIKKNIIFKNTNTDLIAYYSKYFRLIPVKKDQNLITQGRPHEGIFFINKGVFQLKTFKNYYELQELIFSLRDSLDFFTNYISFIKKREEDDLNSEGNNKQNKLLLYKNPLFLIKSSEKKDITFLTYHAPQIIGLNEFYDNKTGVYHFSLNCISDDAEVYFLPNELVSILLSNDSIYNSIACLVEERVKSLLFGIKRYKKMFETEIEKYVSLSKFSPIYNSNRNDNNNFKTLSPIIKSSNETTNNYINKTQIKAISNEEINKKNIIINNDNNNFFSIDMFKKKLYNFNPFSKKEKNKKIINLQEQEKNSNFLTKIKLNKNLNISSTCRYTNNILSDNNKTSEKSETIINPIVQLSKSPSMTNIKNYIYKLINKNDSIINNNQCRNTIKNDFRSSFHSVLEKKHPYNKLFPFKRNFLNNDFHKFIDSSNINSYLKNSRNLYFRKKGHITQIDRSLDKEKENNFFNKIKIKKVFNIELDNVNNNFTFNKKIINRIKGNEMTMKNNLGNIFIKNINNDNKINFKNTIIKSNSSELYLDEKNNQMHKSSLL